MIIRYNSIRNASFFLEILSIRSYSTEAHLIFYTLSGPKFSLEVHDDKIKLVRRGLWKLISREPQISTWEVHNLSSFIMTSPGVLKMGRLEWQSHNGHKGGFRFTTNAEMVRKIERYLQEKIIKNEEKKRAAVLTLVPVKKSRKKAA
jgi:hypothetical protein